MLVWHVTTMKKLSKYKETGYIKPPVRGWVNIEAAERFSKQTGRRIIIRLKFDKDVQKLEGHNGEAVYTLSPVRLENI